MAATPQITTDPATGQVLAYIDATDDADAFAQMAALGDQLIAGLEEGRYTSVPPCADEECDEPGLVTVHITVEDEDGEREAHLRYCEKGAEALTAMFLDQATA